MARRISDCSLLPRCAYCRLFTCLLERLEVYCLSSVPFFLFVWDCRVVTPFRPNQAMERTADRCTLEKSHAPSLVVAGLLSFAVLPALNDRRLSARPIFRLTHMTLKCKRA